MILKRYSIYHLMGWVAVVAFNLAVLRALFMSRRFDILIGGAAVWVALQVGAVLALRSRGRSRPFWQGFVAVGTATSLGLIAAQTFPKSPLGEAWRGYMIVTHDLLYNDRALNMLVKVAGVNGMDLALALIETAVEFLPLVVVATAGRVLARRVCRVGPAKPALPSAIAMAGKAGPTTEVDGM